MCVVSMVGDHYGTKWYPYVNPQPNTIAWPQVSRYEFDQLKAEVENMKELLKRAKQYDEEHGEEDCAMEDKVAILRKVAELVGVDLEDLI